MWGCSAWSGVGKQVQINGVMTADIYFGMVHKYLEYSLLKFGRQNDFLFQQPSDPKHMGSKIIEPFHSSRIKLLDWPAQSSDLNPIKNPWLIFDPKVNSGEVMNKDIFLILCGRRG